MTQIIIPQGANLTTLAQQYGTTIPELIKVNPQITDPNKIFAGQTLEIPALPVSQPQVPPQAIQPQPIQQATPAPQAPQQPISPQFDPNTQMKDPVTGQVFPKPQAPQPIAQAPTPAAGPAQPTTPVNQVQPGETREQYYERLGQPDIAYEERIQRLLDKYGVKAPSDTESSIASFTNTYKQLYEQLDLPTIKGRYDEIQKQYQDLQNERIDKETEINDNPWLNEGTRARKIASLREKYAQKENVLVNQLQLQQSLYESGKQEAQFVAQQGLALSKQGQEFQQDILLKVIDQVEKEMEARRKVVAAPGTIEVEVMKGGQPHRILFNEDTGEEIADLGVSYKTPEKAVQVNLLSPSEAALLGVPYGTTEEDAQKMGITPVPSTQLGTTAQLLQANVTSGLSALDTLENEIKSKGTKGLVGSTLGGLPLVGGLIEKGLGSQILSTARNELIDVLARLRTGAALTASEEEFYKGKLPNALDSSASIVYKLSLFRNLFNNLKQKQASSRVEAANNDPLGLR